MVPVSERVCMFAVLPTGINENDMASCFKAANELHGFAIALGAKRYLPGWVGMMTEAEMSLHYYGKEAELIRLKKSNDPDNVFGSFFSAQRIPFFKHLHS